MSQVSVYASVTPYDLHSTSSFGESAGAQECETYTIWLRHKLSDSVHQIFVPPQ